MADPRLVSYIKEQLKRGYNLYTLKNHLINHGYSAADVDKAINEIYKPTIRHEIHLSKNTIIALSSIFVALILIGSAFFMFKQEPKQLLDLSTDIIESSVEPGQELNFNFELSSLGAAKRYDVLLRYDIIKDKKIITSKEETIAVETRASAKGAIKIPDDAKLGNYMLKATAKYNGKIATASDSFKVYKEVKEEESKKCPSSCDDNNKCTEDYCSEETGFNCMHEEIKPCCGNNICEKDEEQSCPSDCPKKEKKEEVKEDELSGLTIWEALEKIKEISASDPEKAGDYCSKIENIIHKDRCFLNIAEATKSEISCEHISDRRLKDDCYSKAAFASNNYELCEKISTEARKDSCYMNFVMDGNYNVCNRLINEYLKQSCDALKSIEENENGGD